METYKASLDTPAKVITGFVFLLVIGGAIQWFLQSDWILGLITAPLLFFTYMFSVQSYRITDAKLIIKRPISMLDKRIALSEIESVELLSKEDFKGTIRTAGNGGLFGYYGYYANKKLGSFKMYATNRKNRMLITLKNNKKKLVVSPDDVGMADTLNLLLKK